MTDPSRPSERHPVVTGVVALVAVGLVVGLVLGGVVWAGARYAGLDSSATATDGSSTSAEQGDRMVLPRPKETKANPNPLVTLAPIPGGDPSQSAEPRERKKKKVEEGEITLSAGQPAVGVFDQIDLTGQYTGGDGRVLQVERYEGDTWVEFNATVAVTAGTFSTFVQSGQTGPNRFRMVDSSDRTISNPVTVRVG